jgi:hypothetical protein
LWAQIALWTGKSGITDELAKLDQRIAGVEALKAEHKWVEEDLRMEKEFSKNILNTVVDRIFVFDPNTGKPLRWDAAFEINGYTDEEIASKKASDDWYGEQD